MINELLERYPCLEQCKKDIISAKDLLIKCFEGDKKVLLCGNGGSCADCEHIAGELMKGFLKKRPLSDAVKTEMSKSDIDESVSARLQEGLPAIPLTSFTALNTAFCNDVDPELVYAQSLFALGKKDDLLVAISTSGNS